MSRQKPKRTNKWLADDTIKVTDQWRPAKAYDNKDEVKKLNPICNMNPGKTKIGRKRSSVNIWKKGHTKVMFAIVKIMWSSFLAQKETIKDCKGNVQSDQQKIKNMWKEYRILQV